MIAKLEIEHLGPIQSASLEFGDLTVLVGPQASGKSIALQTFMFAIDRPALRAAVDRHGLPLPKSSEELVEFVYGEGMRTIWRPGTTVRFDGHSVPTQLPRRKNGHEKKDLSRGRVFYVPAQRAVLLPDGFPRAFRDVDASAPFVSREFSDTLHRILTTEQSASLFPRKNKLTKEVRDALDEAVFRNGKVELRPSGRKKLELFLKVGDAMLPSIAWTAGQREFAPLLLSLYPLLPPSRMSKAADVDWVVIEELEMGLHPKAIFSVMVLVFELIERGYKVVLSTHHPAVLDIVWGLRQLQLLSEEGLSSQRVAKLFREMVGLTSSPKATKIAERAIASRLLVHAFSFPPGGTGSVSKDITSLDADDPDELTSGWGGLTQFSSNVSDVVTKAVNLLGGEH